MRANPGGYVPPSELIGRARLIEQLWRILESRSVQLLADRRYGKSSVIRAMHDAPPDGWRSVLQDLEGVRTPLEFVDAVQRAAADHLSAKGRASGKLSRLLRDLAGLETLGTRLPERLGGDWKRLLNALFDDLEEQDGERLVFFWDEVPYMLQNVRDTAGEDVARELLDVLRAIRQRSRATRMVFTGSIGLHHVVRSLAANRPTAQAALNDMTSVEVPPIARDDAIELARRLIDGENLATSDPDATAEALAEAAGDLPFYVHHVVDDLAQRGEEASPESVRRSIARAVESPQDPLHLRHYDQRLRAYYGQSEALARMLLDVVAASEPVERDELVARALVQRAVRHRDEALRMIDHLSIDHYLVTGEDGRIAFHNPIVRSFWRHSRMV